MEFEKFITIMMIVAKYFASNLFFLNDSFLYLLNIPKNLWIFFIFSCGTEVSYWA